MTDQKCYFSAYYVKETEFAAKRPFHTAFHKIRDGLALMQYQSAITRSYDFGGVLLNVPTRFQAEVASSAGVQSKSDLVFQATRPPIHDSSEKKEGGRGERRIDKSGSKIERAVFRCLKPYLAKCNRSRITLSKRVELKSKYSQYRDVQFIVKRGAAISKLHVGDDELAPANPQQTLGYLFGLPKLSQNGPRLVVAFGMGGAETVWLSSLLISELRDELDAALTTRRARLRLISFDVPQQAPSPLFEPRLAETIDYEVIPTTLKRPID